MTFVSYAQNFEDVILWRALGHVQHGFYIDVGAQHPLIDSVSKAFYDHGWRGVHVEAVPQYAELLRRARPDETVWQTVLSDKKGEQIFYEIPDTGLSTGNKEIANRHQADGYTLQEQTIPCRTLADLFSTITKPDIHWLKIDVEGMEAEVLAGWGASLARPWIVVVESTLPLLRQENYLSWEYLLLERGYKFSYFDGLNRFYIAQAHLELLPRFSVGPHVFDNFVLNGTASTTFCRLLNNRIDEQSAKVAALKADINSLVKTQERLTERYVNELIDKQKELEQREQQLKQVVEERVGVEYTLVENQQALNTIQRSLSWRLTLPLRKIVAALQHTKYLKKRFFAANPIQLPISPIIDRLFSYENESFIQQTYLAVLGREPDTIGLHHHLAHLRRGVDKILIINRLYHSPEAQAKQVYLPGFERAMRRYKKMKRPFLGYFRRLKYKKINQAAAQQQLAASSKETGDFEYLSLHERSIYTQLKKRVRLQAKE